VNTLPLDQDIERYCLAVTDEELYQSLCSPFYDARIGRSLVIKK
jgi:hypothetical protein